MRPHLIHDHKYDLRIYVLITCYDPLTIYLYQDGLVRFATEPYSTKNKNSRFAHLTNFSVNKRNADYQYNNSTEADDDSENTSKWSLKTLRQVF